MTTRGVILILLLLGGALRASQQPPSNLKIVAADEFYAQNFWETPPGKAFWATADGKLVLRIMLNYQRKIQNAENQ